LYSKRRVGKTFLLLAIGYVIAAGIFFLRWKSVAPVKVLYVDGKMADQLDARVNRQACTRL
jgi:RecA-family ATPase